MSIINTKLTEILTSFNLGINQHKKALFTIPSLFNSGSLVFDDGTRKSALLTQNAPVQNTYYDVATPTVNTRIILFQVIFFTDTTGSFNVALGAYTLWRFKCVANSTLILNAHPLFIVAPAVDNKLQVRTIDAGIGQIVCSATYLETNV